MKKKHPEHVNLERWLISYADFITLLFAFFVIMYAISQADKKKFEKVSASLRSAFSADPAGFIDLGGEAGGNTANSFEVLEPTGGRTMNLPAGKTNTASDPDPQLQEIRELLEETISLDLGATESSDQLQMQFDSRGLIVRLAAKDFFEQGEVEARQDVQPILDRIGRVLSGTKRLIRIEGHTDISEARMEGYPTDWELSSARAAWVARYWIRKFNLEPSHVGVAGYSHFRPLARSDSPWSRAKNRRVEVIILNTHYEAP